MTKRKESGKVLKDKAFKIGRLYGSYERGLASAMFFNKKSSGSGAKSMLNQQIADELHKAIRKFKRLKDYFLFKNNLCGADLADVELISKELDSHYVWLIFLVNMHGLFVDKTRKEERRNYYWRISKYFKWFKKKIKKICVDQGIEFYKKYFKNG